MPETSPQPGDDEAVLRSFLHLARRSGSLALGYRAVKLSLKRGRCHLLILARDAGASLHRLETGRVPVLVRGDRHSLGEWMGRSEVAILGVLDPQMAAGILNRMREEKD